MCTSVGVCGAIQISVPIPVGMAVHGVAVPVQVGAGSRFLHRLESLIVAALCLDLFFVLVLPLVIHPPFAHAHRLLPGREQPGALLPADLGLEDGAARAVDVAQLGEVAPEADGEAGCDGSAEGGGFAHLGAVDGNGDQVCLDLRAVSSYARPSRDVL